MVTDDGGKRDMLVELAKAKSQAAPLRVATTAVPEFEEGEGQLTVDVYQDKDAIIVQSTVAGVNPDELEINITNESITIRGRREKSESIEAKNYFYQECFWGTFSRSIILPQEVDPEKSSAALKNGVLMVRMPKLTRQKARKLKVKVD